MPNGTKAEIADALKELTDLTTRLDDAEALYAIRAKEWAELACPLSVGQDFTYYDDTYRVIEVQYVYERFRQPQHSWRVVVRKHLGRKKLSKTETKISAKKFLESLRSSCAPKGRWVPATVCAKVEKLLSPRQAEADQIYPDLEKTVVFLSLMEQAKLEAGAKWARLAAPFPVGARVRDKRVKELVYEVVGNDDFEVTGVPLRKRHAVMLTLRSVEDDGSLGLEHVNFSSGWNRYKLVNPGVTP